MIKVFFATDGSWGDGDHMLMGEFQPHEWLVMQDELETRFNILGSNKAYEFFKNLPQVVDLDEIEDIKAPEPIKETPELTTVQICDGCKEFHSYHNNPVQGCYCCELGDDD